MTKPKGTSAVPKAHHPWRKGPACPTERAKFSYMRIKRQTRRVIPPTDRR